MRLTLLAVVAAALTACGASPRDAEPSQSTARVSQAPDRADAVEALPIEVDVLAKRFGSALRLDITGTGRGRLEGESFEDPQQWAIEVLQNGASLQRAVNGPVKVARDPVGRATGSRWDVVVRFNVNFVMEEDYLPLIVMIEAPDEDPTKVTIEQL